jgi:hypothetical protein
MNDAQKIESALPLLLMAIASGTWNLVEHAVKILNANGPIIDLPNDAPDGQQTMEV